MVYKYTWVTVFSTQLQFVIQSSKCILKHTLLQQMSVTSIQKTYITTTNVIYVYYENIHYYNKCDLRLFWTHTLLQQMWFTSILNTYITTTNVMYVYSEHIHYDTKCAWHLFWTHTCTLQQRNWSRSMLMVFLPTSNISTENITCQLSAKIVPV